MKVLADPNVQTDRLGGVDVPAASVLLDNDLILTVTDSSQAGNSWQAVKDHTDFFAVR